MLDTGLLKLLEGMKKYSEERDNIFAIPAEEGKFLHLLVMMMRPERILELGTSSGYSTIWLASAAATYGGLVETVENDKQKIKLALSNFSKAELFDTITLHHADANEFVTSYQAALNMVFMDTAKNDYLHQFKHFFPKLSQGGVVLADNAVDLADKMQDYLVHVKNLEGAMSVTVPIGNGVEMTYKL